MEKVRRRYGGNVETAWIAVDKEVRRCGEGGGEEKVWRRCGEGVEKVWRKVGRRCGEGMEKEWVRRG